MIADQNREVVSVAVPQPRQNQTVLWVIAILLAIIATALVLRTDLPFSARPAYGDSPRYGAGGIFAFTGQIDRNSYGLFMMDVDNSTIWCYQYVPSMGKLRLVAARSYVYDRYLENLNCVDETSPEEISKLLEKQREIKNRISSGGISPDVPLEEADITTDVGTHSPTTQSEDGP
ncbi:MAG: hypothetical protein IPK83_02420 [Planctomycetes bacterium]|nr:hypothetical protein [Planctomycetota bacterium]